MVLVVKDGEQLVRDWKAKHLPPVDESDPEWAQFKVRRVKKGEWINPILMAGGDEIAVEQFGIVGFLNERDLHPDSNFYDGKTKEKITRFMSCSLVEARRTGTGRFGEWCENVKKYVQVYHKMPFAFHNITNEHLYKYCERHKIWVADDKGMLYSVKTKP